VKIKGWGSSLKSILSKSDISEQDWQDVEDMLLLADIGSHWSKQIISALKKSAVSKSDLMQEVANQLRAALTSNRSRELQLQNQPAVIIMVGVNGVGKTTSVGKIGAMQVAAGKSVVFGAADTFRAAAVEQLKTWGERTGVPVIAKEPGSDPASVAHEVVSYAQTHGTDLVLLDTAGRLHNKKALMDELSKVVKVAGRVSPVSEILLVIDATVGQNGLAQAKLFGEAVELTGVVLTKFDGTAKGGIVISIEQELGIPVKFIGIGEGVADLLPFDSEWFISQLLETNL
jgi:fused signal recognition particle receptor